MPLKGMNSDTIVWNENSERAFLKLKNEITEETVLMAPQNIQIIYSFNRCIWYRIGSCFNRWKVWAKREQLHSFLGVLINLKGITPSQNYNVWQW